MLSSCGKTGYESGGVVGAVIDSSKGTAYNYPSWVQLVFGEKLVFDRHNSHDSSPTIASIASPAPAQGSASQVASVTAGAPAAPETPAPAVAVATGAPSPAPAPQPSQPSKPSCPSCAWQDAYRSSSSPLPWGVMSK
jgi:hypothetical protein